MPFRRLTWIHPPPRALHWIQVWLLYTYRKVYAVGTILMTCRSARLFCCLRSYFRFRVPCTISRVPIKRTWYNDFPNCTAVMRTCRTIVARNRKKAFAPGELLSRVNYNLETKISSKNKCSGGCCKTFHIRVYSKQKMCNALTCD